MLYIHNITKLTLTDELKHKFLEIITEENCDLYDSLDSNQLKMFEDFKKCIANLDYIEELFVAA